MQSIHEFSLKPRLARFRGFLFSLLLLLAVGVVPISAHAQAWSLTQAQRQAYLNY